MLANGDFDVPCIPCIRCHRIFHLCVIGTVEYATLDDARGRDKRANHYTVKQYHPHLAHNDRRQDDHFELGDYNLLLDASANTDFYMRLQ